MFTDSLWLALYILGYFDIDTDATSLVAGPISALSYTDSVAYVGEGIYSITYVTINFAFVFAGKPVNKMKNPWS